MGVISSIKCLLGACTLVLCTSVAQAAEDRGFIVPSNGRVVLTRECFFPFRVPKILATEVAAFEGQIAVFSDVDFNALDNGVTDHRLSQAYRDIVRLPPHSWSTGFDIGPTEHKTAQRRVFVEGDPANGFTERYKGFRAEAFKREEAIALFGGFAKDEFAYGKSEYSRELVAAALINLIDVKLNDVRIERNLFTRAREIVDAYHSSSPQGLWASRVRKASLILDGFPGSPRTILVPAPRDLIATDIGWERILVEIPAELGFSADQAPELKPVSIAFDVAIIRIIRPWLDMGLLDFEINTHLRDNNSNSLGINLIFLEALRNFPAKIPTALVLVRNIQFLSPTVEHRNAIKLPSNDSRSAQIKDLALLLSSKQEVSVIGVILDRISND